MVVAPDSVVRSALLSGCSSNGEKEGFETDTEVISCDPFVMLTVGRCAKIEKLSSSCSKERRSLM